MKLDEMSPAMRRRVVAAIAKDELAAVKRPVAPSGKSARRTGGGHWTCQPCGQTFDRYPPAERHIDGTHGAGRIVFDLELDGLS